MAKPQTRKSRLNLKPKSRKMAVQSVLCDILSKDIRRVQSSKHLLDSYRSQAFIYDSQLRKLKHLSGETVLFDWWCNGCSTASCQSKASCVEAVVESPNKATSKKWKSRAAPPIETVRRHWEALKAAKACPEMVGGRNAAHVALACPQQRRP